MRCVCKCECIINQRVVTTNGYFDSQCNYLCIRADYMCECMINQRVVATNGYFDSQCNHLCIRAEFMCECMCKCECMEIGA